MDGTTFETSNPNDVCAKMTRAQDDGQDDFWIDLGTEYKVWSVYLAIAEGVTDLSAVGVYIGNHKSMWYDPKCSAVTAENKSKS